MGYLPASLLQAVVGFATLMAFTRVLSPTDYGAYVLAYGVSSVAYTLVFTWMESAMARFYPAERNADPDAPLLYGTLYRLFVLIALLFLGLLAAATALWLGWGLLFQYGFVASLAGGALTLAILELRRHELPEKLLKIAFVGRLAEKNGGVPYGVALALAGLVVYPQSVLWMRLSGF